MQKCLHSQYCNWKEEERKMIFLPVSPFFCRMFRTDPFLILFSFSLFPFITYSVLSMLIGKIRIHSSLGGKDSYSGYSFLIHLFGPLEPSKLLNWKAFRFLPPDQLFVFLFIHPSMLLGIVEERHISQGSNLCSLCSLCSETRAECFLYSLI